MPFPNFCGVLPTFSGGFLGLPTRRPSGAFWTPAQLPNLAIWLDADDASTITLNGSTVSQWDDKSGNARHVIQGVSSRQPAYVANSLNGNSVVRYSTSTQFLETNTKFGSAAQRSVFSLNTYTATPQYQYVWQMESDPTEGAALVFRAQSAFADWQQNDTVSWADGYSSGRPPRFISNGITGDGSAAIHGLSLGNQESQLRINGASANARVQLTGAWPNIARKFSVGRDTQSLDGDVAEIIYVDGVISTTDRQKVEGYLAWKWGLSHALPSNHPYRWDTSLFGGTNLNGFDADAKTYIASVETADKQDLETGVRTAINDFVVGCKADNIWNAIKASSILAGARTLSGALQPLAGTAPTNFNFVSGDYDRKTGLKGDGSTKYLDSNRNNNADPQNSKHIAVYAAVGAGQNNNSLLLATTNVSGRSALVSFVTGAISVRINSNISTAQNGNGVGFVGGVRTSSTETSARVGGTDFPETVTSQTPLNESLGVFASGDGNSATDARLSFYSIGEALDLAALDTRVSNLMTAIGAAIP